MSDVEKIKAAILAFHWWNFGLDDVGEADPEYAEHLAAEIVAALGAAELWALHVVGPDDIIAMPDRETADAKAIEVNGLSHTLRERPDASPMDPHFSATVVAWDGTAEEHAQCLAEVIAEGEYLP